MRTSAPLADAYRRLGEIARSLLAALVFRSRAPRLPPPIWTTGDARLPPPPLDEILWALAPPDSSSAPDSAESTNHALIAALQASQQLATLIAEEKSRLLPLDTRQALDTGDRDLLQTAFADLTAEFARLDAVRDAHPRIAPHLPADLVVLLWREHLLPWTRQTEIAYVLEP